MSPKGVLTVTMPKEGVCLILNLIINLLAHDLSSLTGCTFCKALSWDTPAVDLLTAPVLMRMPINECAK